MSRCIAVAITVDAKTETIRARVAPGFGTPEDAAALAELISAGRRRMAAESHPEHTVVDCPRCGAVAGTDCTTAGGRPLPWGHRERHDAAIAVDGRTCAAEGA